MFSVCLCVCCSVLISRILRIFLFEHGVSRSVTESLSICLRLIRLIRTVPSSVSVFSVCLRVRYLFSPFLKSFVVSLRYVSFRLLFCEFYIKRNETTKLFFFIFFFASFFFFVFFSIARAWPMHNMADDHAAGLPTHVFAGEPQKSHEIFAFLIFFSYLCSVFPEKD